MSIKVNTAPLSNRFLNKGQGYEKDQSALAGLLELAAGFGQRFGRLERLIGSSGRINPA
jgi:hypothetical protein